MQKIFFAALFVLISGCATPVTKLNVPGIERSGALMVKDLRPETEKQNKIFSLMATSVAFATYRVGDVSISPPPIRLLQHRVFEKLGSDPTSLDVKVHHLVVYRNLQAELRGGALGAAIGGGVGAVLVGTATRNLDNGNTTMVDRDKFDSLADEEYYRASYSPQENPGRASVYIFYIDTEIGGKRLFTRTLSPMKTKESDNALNLALETAIESHLAKY